MSAPPNRALKLYRHPLSGHCHRVEAFLSILGLPFETVDICLGRGEQRSPDFLRLNPFGQIPVLDDGGIIIADSHAILVYLAGRYGGERWRPADPAHAAEIQRWLSVTAGPLVNGPAMARRANVLGAEVDMAAAHAVADRLFRVMEEHLGGRRFLIGDEASIADLAGYAYVAHAPEGGISLEPFPNIRSWLWRIEDLPGFVPMVRSEIGLWEA